MSLCCIIGYKLVTVMDGVKFEFNVIISCYKKTDSEHSQPMILLSIFDDIIVNKAIYVFTYLCGILFKFSTLGYKS